MQVTGKVHEVGSVNNVTDKFKRREIILEITENPQYPEYVKFESTQDKVSLMDKCSVGDMVQLDFNLKGRMWTNKEGVVSYFNTLQIWRLDKLSSGSPQNAPINAGSSDDDSLPF